MSIHCIGLGALDLPAGPSEDAATESGSDDDSEVDYPSDVEVSCLDLVPGQLMFMFIYV